MNIIMIKKAEESLKLLDLWKLTIYEFQGNAIAGETGKSYFHAWKAAKVPEFKACN